jgi:hypothetical protein
VESLRRIPHRATRSGVARFAASFPALALVATATITPAGLHGATAPQVDAHRARVVLLAPRLSIARDRTPGGAVRPRIAIVSDYLVVRDRRVDVELRCTDARCAGSLLLIDRQKGRPHYELGSAGYRLAADTAAVVVVHLNHQGLVAVARARGGTFPATAVATLNLIGTGDSRVVTLAA